MSPPWQAVERWLRFDTFRPVPGNIRDILMKDIANYPPRARSILQPRDSNMKKLDNVVYTSKTHTTGRREGFARSDDASITALARVSRSAMPSGMLRIRFQ
jgi:hypothetical protein